MTRPLKPSKKHEHVFAIVRYETDADANTPIELRVTIKKVVLDPQFAEMEVKRLNELNKEKGAHYFYQVTRFEGVPLEVQSVPPMQLTATEENPA
jgi:hypothetical protein